MKVAWETRALVGYQLAFLYFTGHGIFNPMFATEFSSLVTFRKISFCHLNFCFVLFVSDARYGQKRFCLWNISVSFWLQSKIQSNFEFYFRFLLGTSESQAQLQMPCQEERQISTGYCQTFPVSLNNSRSSLSSRQEKCRVHSEPCLLYVTKVRHEKPCKISSKKRHLRVNIIVVSKTLQIHIRSLHFFVMIVFYAFITLCTVKSGLLEQCVYCVHNQF